MKPALQGTAKKGCHECNLTFVSKIKATHIIVRTWKLNDIYHFDGRWTNLRFYLQSNHMRFRISFLWTYFPYWNVVPGLVSRYRFSGAGVESIKDDKTEENTFEILQHSDRNINNS